MRPNWAVNERRLLSFANSGPSGLRRIRCPTVGLARCSRMLPLNSRTPASFIFSSPRRSRAISSVATDVPMSCAITNTSRSPTSASAASACQPSVYSNPLGFSERPKPRQSKAMTGGSGRSSSRRRQSYELDGKPCSSSQRHALTLAPVHEQPATGDLLGPPGGPPLQHPLREHDPNLYPHGDSNSDYGRERPAC